MVAFVNLGFWQLRRHDEKLTLRDAVAESQARAPVRIGDAPPGSYRRVTAAGSYDAGLQTRVLRAQAGVSGYHVLTPFVYENGVAVLVDRGWIPLDAEPPAPFSGEVVIEGTLWPAEGGSSVPAAFPEAVPRIDAEIQQAFAAYEFIDEYLVLNGFDHDADELPILPDPPSIALGPHLGYAGQWFLFTLVVLIGYPTLLIRRARRP